MSVLAFVNLPNAIVGQATSGIIVTNSSVERVVMTLDSPSDGTVSVLDRSGSEYRVFDTTFTPARTGIVSMTIQAVLNARVTETRRVSLIVVPEGENPPESGSPRFRKLLPEGVIAKDVVATPDNGFWMIFEKAAGTVTLDGVTITTTAAAVVAAKYDQAGVCQHAAHIVGKEYSFSRAACTDETGALYMYNTTATFVPEHHKWVNADGSTAFAPYTGFAPGDQWLSKLSVAGVWQWERLYDYQTSGEHYLAVHGSFVYLAFNAEATEIKLDGPAYTIPEADGATYVLCCINRTTGALVRHINNTGCSSFGGLSGPVIRVKGLAVNLDAEPIILLQAGESSVSTGESGIGVSFTPRDVIAAYLNFNLERLNFARLTDDRIKFEISNVFQLDPGSNSIWFTGYVSEDGAKVGHGDAQFDVPEGTNVSWVIHTDLNLDDVGLLDATDEVRVTGGYHFGVGLPQPGVPVLVGSPAGTNDATVVVTEISEDTATFSSRTVKRSGSSASEVITGQTNRPNGGLVLAVEAGAYTATSDLLFVEDPSPLATVSIPADQTRTALVTMDADGTWSAVPNTPTVGVTDPILDLPLDGLDPGTWEEGEPSTPGAPGPATLPEISEDTVLACHLGWLDHDEPDETQSYTVEFAPSASGPWSEDGFVGPTFFLTALTDRREASDRLIPIVIVPEANWFGSYGFYARVTKSNYPTDLVSAVAHITGTVVGATDAPSQPSPSRMPTVEAGIAAQGTFIFVDPDGTSWTPTVSLTRDGTYGSTITLPGKGTVSVSDSDNTDHEFDLRFDPTAGGYTGTYSFWVKVTDSTGLASVPLLVSGVVSSANVMVELQRVTRTTEDVTFEALTPLTTLIDMSVTEALDGPGAATLTVAASELKRRATTLGISPASLVKAGSVEVRVAVNGTPLFTGPVTGYRHDLTQEQVTIEATGLMGYLEARAIEGTSPKTFTGEEQSQIIWDLVDDEQQKPFGKLGLTDGTVDTSRVIPTISFEPKSTVASAIYELRDRLNGPEVWIDPDRVVRTATRRGTDRRGQIVFTPQNTSRFETSTDWKVLSNIIHVYGTGATSSASDNSSLAAFGRMVKPLDAEQLTTEAACATVAANYLGDLKELPEAYYIVHDANPERPFGLLDYGVGDAVTIEADTLLGRITADVRIVSRTIRLVQGTASSFDVELELERVSSDGVIRARRSDHNPEIVAQLYDALYRR